MGSGYYLSTDFKESKKSVLAGVRVKLLIKACYLAGRTSFYFRNTNILTQEHRIKQWKILSLPFIPGSLCSICLLSEGRGTVTQGRMWGERGGGRERQREALGKTGGFCSGRLFHLEFESRANCKSDESPSQVTHVRAPSSSEGHKAE